MTHELGPIRTSRGKRRTTFYAYCSCGHGIPASVNVASVERKFEKHKEVAAKREP